MPAGLQVRWVVQAVLIVRVARRVVVWAAVGLAVAPLAVWGEVVSWQRAGGYLEMKEQAVQQGEFSFHPAAASLFLPSEDISCSWHSSIDCIFL